MCRRCLNGIPAHGETLYMIGLYIQFNKTLSGEDDTSPGGHPYGPGLTVIEDDNMADSKMIPLMISPKGLKVLIVGGGPVALRKCMHFKGADVTVISKDTVPEIEDMDLALIKRKASASEISRIMSGFDIVIAATDNAVLNSEIRDDALRRGLYVNSAHGGGNVTMPSVLRRDRYTVSVSSGGALPAFPPFVVGELGAFLDGRFDTMFDILLDLRGMCAGKKTQAERAEFLRKAARDPEVNMFARCGDKASALERGRELWGAPL